MESSTSRECQKLCRRAAVEHDPVRLLALFLQIDRLANQQSPKCTRVGNTLCSALAISSIICPHCCAIIELPGPRATGNLLYCPWCSGLVNICKGISGSEYDSEGRGLGATAKCQYNLKRVKSC